MKGLTEHLRQQLIPENTILLGYRGSVAHGTYIRTYGPDVHDDKDLLGVCIGPKWTYFGLRKFEQRERTALAKDGVEWDSIVYELRKFVKLLLKCNPNVLSLLFLPEHLYIIRKPLGNRLIEKRDIFVSREAYFSYVGYAKGQMHRMTHPSGKHMGAKRRRLVEKFGYDCYDDKTTEFLTNSGWKRFDAVAKGDLLATLDSDHRIELQTPISRIDKEYNGVMYWIEPYSSKAFVTEGHNLLVSPVHRNPKNRFSTAYREEQSDWHLESIRSLIDGKRSHFHILRAPLRKDKDHPGIEDDYLRLAGAYLSEGSAVFQKNKTETKVKAIKITQTAPGSFWSLMDTLCKKYAFKRYDYKKETVWILYGDAARKLVTDFGYRKGKLLPFWCLELSARQVEILWSSLMAGDGSRKKANDCYYTSSPILADDLQAVCIMAGLPCTKYGPYKFRTPLGACTMFHVVRSRTTDSIHCLRTHVLSYGKTPALKKEGYPIKETKVEKQRVVCFEVPNGVLITRNNGKVAIHGNCKNASHLIRLLRLGIEFLSTGDMRIEREDAAELIEIKRGEWTLQRVQAEADRLFALAQEAFIHSLLPPKPDTKAAEQLTIKILEEWFNKENGPIQGIDEAEE